MCKPRLYKCSLFLAFVISACATKNQRSEFRYISVGANIWQLELADNKNMITADYEGKISLRNQEGLAQWQYETEAFVFDLKIGDINNNGMEEIAVVTAQGQLLVLDGQGQLSWEFQSVLPLFNVGIGDFTGDSHLEIACGGIDRHVYILDHQGKLLAKSPKMERLVHRLVVGDLDLDQKDDLLIIENRTIAHLMGFEQDSLVSKFRKELKVPDGMVNWENPRGNFYPFSIEIADLEGDGIPEILMGDTFFNKQAVMVTDNKAQPLWISEGLTPFKRKGPSQLEFYSTAFVRAADLYPEIPGNEIISVAGGMFRVWDLQGKLLGAQNAAVGFTDIEIWDRQIFLGSSPNGDDQMYQLTFGEGWETVVSDLEYRGKINRIKQNTDQLMTQVERYQPDSVPEIRYDLVVGFGSIDATNEGAGAHRRQIAWFKNKFPYSNLRFIRGMKLIEVSPPLDESGQPWSEQRWRTDAINGTYSVDEIIAKARWVEENRIPTDFLIGHSCMPFITLETAEKILQVSPNYGLGFRTAEDEQLERLPRYFKHYFSQLADLCLKYGNKKSMTKNKGLWWMSTPANAVVFESMFGEGRDQVAASATEDSNSRTPEINLMGRGGLWQAGLLKHNEVSIHGDLFSFNRFHQWEYPKVGHPYLRLLVAHTTMGMDRMSSRIREVPPETDIDTFSHTGAESTEIYYHLLGKGLVFSPRPEDVMGYSPVGVVVHQPSDKWLLDAHNGHRPELWQEDEELHQAVFPHNGSLWGMTNTPDHAFQKVIFKKQRQFGYQVPATPYGLVAFVPEHTDLDNVAGVEEWWHTDGIYVWKDPDVKYTGMEAAELLRQDFEKALLQMPFRQTGETVFMQVIKMATDHYRLFLVDPGWIDPRDRSVKIEIQMEGEYLATNVLEDLKYQVIEGSFKTQVPAGLFAIIDVVKNL